MFTRGSRTQRSSGKPYAAWRASRHWESFRLILLACVLTAFAVHPAQAQGGCDCLTIGSSAQIGCDTCHIDSVHWVGVPPHMVGDTIWTCDTCWSFTLTNNCPYAISDIKILDTSGGSGKKIHYGCALIQNAAEDTAWGSYNDTDGSIRFSDTSGTCLQPHETLIVSICHPMNRGDTITLFWWVCGLPYKDLPDSPICQQGQNLIV
ncbi:MAG TPA: hypothetical protein VGM92_03145, partial [Candidatus Kapabacteria bacterium]